MLSIVDLILKLFDLQKVVIPLEAPLELMAFPTLFFQKRDDRFITSSFGILVSWMSRMSGFSDFNKFLRTSTLIDPPKPLQFQETTFIISWMCEILLGI